MRVAIAGAGGLIGGALAESLGADGHDVRRLVRGRDTGGGIAWPAPAPPAVADVEDLDAVVHLAGVGIASGLWTAGRRRAIRESRVAGTAGIAEALAATRRPPRVLVCASAVGFYGDRGHEIVDEDSPGGRGFLADLARDWEAASAVAARAGIRVANLRTGVVLSRRGGALPRMLPAFRLGLGARLGNGRQYFSWVTLADAVRVIRFVIANDALAGPVNVVAGAVTNAEFTRALARAVRRPAPFVAPAWLLRLVAGDLAREALLSGQRVRSRRLAGAGFAFADTDLDDALRRLVERPGPREGTGPGAAHRIG